MTGETAFRSLRADAGRCARTRTEASTTSGDMPASVSMRVEAGPAAAAAARGVLIALGERVDRDLLGDVRLLVSELVTNSVRHSNSREGGVVGLDIAVARETLRVEVSDPGRGFEPTPRVPGQSKAGGWGLYLVDRLADRWGVLRNSVTRVWFEIDFAS